MKTLTYDNAQVIFYQNDDSKYIFHIEEGKVGIYVDYNTDQELLIRELGKGELFGEMGVLEGSPRSCTVVALADQTTLLEIDEADFEDYFGRDPEKTLKLLKLLSDRIRQTTEKYLDVCRVAYNSREAELKKEKRSEKINRDLDRICEEYGKINTLWLD